MDMLVKLYALPPSRDLFERLGKAAITTRRALAPEKHKVVAWVRQNFSDAWASEVDVAFSRQPVSCFIAIRQKSILGFACHDATCPDFFGPTGVDQNERKNGIGKALLFNCLEAMKQQGYGYAIIGGVGPAEFYAKTLGKILVEGPDAGELLDRLYPNRLSDLQPGRIRYGVLTTDGGRIMDDGTVTRLGDELFYLTTTSTGSDAVFEWMEWWNAVWGYEVEIVNVTGALAAVNVAGPGAREALARLTDADVSAASFPYLASRQVRVTGVPCLALRIGFVGELGYELHFTAAAGEHLWDAFVAGGARPFGLEPQRILRLEKAHVIVGQDTDTESTLLSAGLPWLLKLDKDDFVGKWAAEHVQRRGVRERLVGFTMPPGLVPLEGGQVVRDGRSVAA